MIVAIDYDDTLVDVTTQEWLPGALAALRSLRKQGHKIVIHSTRANSQWGIDVIRAKLGPMFKDVQIEPKPKADVYIDDRARRFDGDWPATLHELRQHAAA